MPRTTAGRLVISALCVVSGLTFGLAAPALAAPTARPTLSDSYTAVGTSHITSIDADLPIAKTKLVESLDVKTLHIVKGTLPIAPQSVSFTVFGILPVRATTTLTQVSPITGTITPTKKGNVLKTAVSYSIKLSDIEAEILGQWVPLDVGNNCTTINPVVIATSTPKGTYFDIAKGGTLTGTYTIGKFHNCAPLELPDPTGLGSLTVNSLVPGSNNTVSITLSHGRFVKG